MKRSRSLLRSLHSWLGLVLLVPLLLQGLTGLLLIVGKPVDRALDRELFVVEPGQARRGLDAIHAGLVERFGSGASFVYRPPRADDESLIVHVDGTWHGRVFVDPYTGRLLGEREGTGAWFDWLFELHAELLSGQTGRAVLAAGGLGGLLLIASGYWLWWPAGWSSAFRVHPGAGQVRLLFDLHRVGGAVAGLLIASSLLSGVYMAWRPVSGFVSAIAGEAPLVPPSLPAVALESPHRRLPSIDRLVAAADLALPGGRPGYVEVPADPARPVRVRKRLPGETHPNGLSMVWLDPRTAEVLRVTRHDELDPGTQLFRLMYPLHIGELGGAAHLLLTGVSGAMLASLSVLGVWLWGSRRPVPRARRRSR